MAQQGWHPLERRLLALFAPGLCLSEAEIARQDGTLGPAQISMAVEWLRAKGVLEEVSEQTRVSISLTERGLKYAEKKHPALRMAEILVQQGTLSLEALRERDDLEADEIGAGIGMLKKSGLLDVTAGGHLQRVDSTKIATLLPLQQLIERIGSRTFEIETFSETERELIRLHQSKRGKSKEIFRMDTRRTRSYALTALHADLPQTLRSEDTASQRTEIPGGISMEMLKTAAWRDKKIRPYDISLPAPRRVGGQRHPYRAFLDHVKEKFVGMGFIQMRGPLVESEFWNMDALYMPQYHPARAIHDVYYLREDLQDTEIPNNLIQRVAMMHEKGGHGSRGWRYPFDIARTRRLILRSQGTAVSSRTLATGPQVPGKYFSIARCFRHDAVDATHAPDFFQVEGIMLGEEIRFTTLLGLLMLFAKEMAETQEIQFLPAYFPFTEPSVEMHVRHPDLGWIELGGAGLLRPEVTGPLGIRVPVIAWGMGLDRMAMVALQITDIRDLFSSDLGLIRDRAIVV